MTERGEKEYNEEVITGHPGMFFRTDDDGLSLISGNQELRGDFTKLIKRIRSNDLQRELVVRAARIKGKVGPFKVIDATAGLGEDSFLLAAAGYTVQLYERDHIIAMLLGDALRRAAEVPELSNIVQRMELVEGDSIMALTTLEKPPDIVLLDPMFPARQKSGLVKKKLQMLQQLEQPCTDEAALLQAAIDAGPRKVIIKRPAKGEYLAGIKPSYSIEGSVIRYDCIVQLGGKA